MVQSIWIFSDYLIFLSRLIVSSIYFNLSYKNFLINKIKSFLFFILALSLLLGFYSSLSNLILLTFEIAKFIKGVIKKEINLDKLGLVAYFIILLSIGPGAISIDRLFEIRLTN